MLLEEKCVRSVFCWIVCYFVSFVIWEFSGQNTFFTACSLVLETTFVHKKFAASANIHVSERKVYFVLKVHLLEFLQ